MTIEGSGAPFDEDAAFQLLSRLSREIKSYNQGKRSATPEAILKMVNELKRKFANSETTRSATNHFRAWFTGRVPERASESMRSGGQLLRDWEDAEDRSYEYIKEWQCRQARETIESFLTAREAVLDQADLDHYKKKVEQALDRIDLLAEGIYLVRQRIASHLEKHKCYAQAIKVYQQVFDKFGIVLYSRKAQEEIDKLKRKK